MLGWGMSSAASRLVAQLAREGWLPALPVTRGLASLQPSSRRRPPLDSSLRLIPSQIARGSHDCMHSLVCRSRCAIFYPLVFCASAFLSGCYSQPSGPDAELREALEAAYPGGWRYATLRADLHSEMRAGDSPAYIQGDFNGDRRPDYATQVVAFAPGHTLAVDSAQVLLAFLRQEDGFARHVLNTGGGPHEGIYLSRIEAGDSIQDFEGGPILVLHADAVSQTFANEASLAFVYERGRWKEIALSD